MAQINLIMPKMGESIMEATIIRWTKQVGDAVAADETVLEIATDKVDSEVPSPNAGTMIKLLYNEGDTVPVGEVIAVLDTAVESTTPQITAPTQPLQEMPTPLGVMDSVGAHNPNLTAAVLGPPIEGRFYSPLVLNIAREEHIPMAELERVMGTGSEGRVTKKDMLEYLAQKKVGAIPLTIVQPPRPEPLGNGSLQGQSQSLPFAEPPQLPRMDPPRVEQNLREAVHTEPDYSTPLNPPKTEPQRQLQASDPTPQPRKKTFSIGGEYDVIEMDRMRKMIAENMVYSKQTSPHVTSFVEADVTPVVNWRDKHKTAFEAGYHEKLTYTPMFVQAVARALRDFPMVNIAVDGDRILVRKDINIGVAVALPTGNLIVPVIRNADRLNLAGLARAVNDLSARARAGKLTPDDLTDGTYTLSNVGTFGNVMGTPIILQPQVAILAVGAIRKKPAVIETPQGDLIGIRQMMFLSHSYDHRVVDGALGGQFVRRVADYLEAWDEHTQV